VTNIKLVRDLMTVGVPRCAPDTPIIDVARRLLQEDLEGLIVLDREGHAVGVVSRKELIRAYGRDDFQSLTAEEVMSEGVLQIPPDIPLGTAAQIMEDEGVRIVFMMHHAEGIYYPAAVLTYTHILRHIAADDANDLNDLGIKAQREPPLDTFIKRRDAARRRGASSPDQE